jgi:hypothetical protein
MTHPARPRAAHAALALLLVGPLAHDVSAAAPRAKPAEAPPAQAPAPAPDALRGPDVDDASAPLGPGGSIAGDSAAMREGDPRPIPHRVFIQTVLSLNLPEPRGKRPASGAPSGPDDQPPEQSASPSVRLSQEQIDAIRTIAKEHQAKVDAYRKAHRDELEQADPPADASGMSPEQAEKRRARIAELRRNAPSPANAQAMIFALLTEPQREAVNARLEAYRNERIEDRAKGEARDQIESYEKRKAARPSRDAARERPQPPPKP